MAASAKGAKARLLACQNQRRTFCPYCTPVVSAKTALIGFFEAFSTLLNIGLAFLFETTYVTTAIMMHPSRQAYVEEDEPEVSFHPSRSHAFEDVYASISER